MNAIIESRVGETKNEFWIFIKDFRNFYHNIWLFYIFLYFS